MKKFIMSISTALLISASLASLSSASSNNDNKQFPGICYQIGENKWESGALALDQNPQDKFVNIQNNYDKDGKVEWSFYVVRNENGKYYRLTYYYNDLVSRSLHN